MYFIERPQLTFTQRFDVYISFFFYTNNTNLPTGTLSSEARSLFLFNFAKND